MSRIRKKRLIENKAAHAIKANSEIILLPKQKEFMFLEDRFSALSGGFGSAKTYAGCMKGIILSALFPGNSGVVCRKTYPELRDATRKTFLELLPQSWILDWNEAFNTLLLKNGSQILFRPIDDICKQRSINFGWFYIDQAEEVEENDFLELVGRLRHPVSKQFGFLTLNPDGHNWIWKLFFNTDKPKYKGINSITSDNPYLPDDYIQSLLTNYPKDWLDKFFYGSHEVKSGIILSEYTDDLQIDPFIIPSQWIKARGMDWGVAKPTTKISVALGDDGVFYVFDCYGQAGNTPEEHAASILERDTGIAHQFTKMDSTAWNRKGDTKETSKLSVAMQFIKAGLSMSPATRDWSGSIMYLNSMMKQGKIKFFRGCCDALIEEIKMYKYGRPVAGKEVPAVGEDHYIDGWRYVVYALSGRRSDSPVVEKSKTDDKAVRSIILKRLGRSVIQYDSVTGAPRL